MGDQVQSMTKLRPLKRTDAERMLEWMHDASVVEKMHTDFSSKTLKDCQSFIADRNDPDNLHLAITDDDDNYMGTVSLKHISGRSAEFAIAMHGDAIGKGYAYDGMKEILKIGFEKYDLNVVYWCVSSENIRALRFYEKHGYDRCSPKTIDIKGNYTSEEIRDYIWFCTRKE